MTITLIGRPIPIPRAILWKPAAGAEARMPGYPVFIEQSALQALHEHSGASPKDGVLGFLVGDLCRDPETRVSYVMIDATIRLNQAVYGDKTGVVVGKLWDRIQPQLQEIGGQLIGWYHSHPPHGPVPAPGDQETHLMYFTQPWQIAIVLAREGDRAAGGVFRPTRDSASVRTALPFYELLAEAAPERGGLKVSVLEWTNYRTDARVQRGPSAAPAAGEEAVEKPGGRTTLQIVRPKIPQTAPPRRPVPPQAKPPAPPEPPPKTEPPTRKEAPPQRQYTPTVRRSHADDELNPGLLDLLGPAKSPPPAPKTPPSDDELEIERASDLSSGAAPPPPPPPPPTEVRKPEPKKPEPKKPEPKKPEPRPSRPTVRPKAIEDLPLLVDIDEVAEEKAPPAPPAPPTPRARPGPTEPPLPELIERELDAAFEEAPELPAEPSRAAVWPTEPEPDLLEVPEEAPPPRRARRWPYVLAAIVLFGAVGAAVAVKGFLLRGRQAAPERAPSAAQPAPRVERPPPRPPVRPAGPVIAPARTGFIAGAGQRGRIGTRLPQPLVLAVRDTADRPVAGQAVTFAAANATLDPPRGVTDSAGQLRTEVTLGPRAQTVTIAAKLGSIERTATVTAVPGPAARIAIACGGEAVSGRLTIALGAPAVLRLGVEDIGGNGLAVTGLRVAVGDERVLRVAATAASGTSGSVTLRPGRAGTTNVAVVASGLRENLAATVAREGARCP